LNGKSGRLQELVLKKYGNLQRFQDETGIPRTNIYNWDRRGIDTMSIANLRAVCAALDCAPDEIAELYYPMGKRAEICSEEEQRLLEKFRNNEQVANAIRLVIR